MNIKEFEDQGEFYLINFPKIEKLESKNFILEAISNIRQKVISIFEKTLPNTAAGLLLGIVFGIKESIPSSFYEDLRNSGTLHVTAASGMNVTMVGGFLSYVFAFFLRRQIAILAAVLGILVYAVLAGLEPSIVRASIMGVLAFSAQILGRQSMAALALLLTGYIMLLINPNLIFDVGFQLSFLATAGLLFILPVLNFRSFIIGNDLATTISAQLAVLPILFSNFGTYSLWSIVANTLILWTIPFLMILGGLAGLTGLILEPSASIFLYFSLPLLLYFEKVASIFSDFGQITFNLASWPVIVGYYLLLIAFVIRKK